MKRSAGKKGKVRDGEEGVVTVRPKRKPWLTLLAGNYRGGTKHVAEYRNQDRFTPRNLYWVH